MIDNEYQDTTPIVRRIKMCELCGGEVIRYTKLNGPEYFECLGCGALGDIIFGIMTRLDRKFYESK